MGTVSTGWPWARAWRRVVLPEFSRPMTTMSSFLVKNTSRSLRSTFPMVAVFVFFVVAMKRSGVGARDL